VGSLGIKASPVGGGVQVNAFPVVVQDHQDLDRTVV